MRFITAAAISRRTVTLVAAVLLLAGGVFAYNSLQVELFPEIEFPLVVVTTSYAGADPEGVVQDVTSPIERAISGAEGLEPSSPPASKATRLCWLPSRSARTWPMRKAT